ERAPDHTLSSDTIKEELALWLPPTEPLDPLFKTIVAWARYAELFGYNATSGEFYRDVEAEAERAGAAAPPAGTTGS
ncbi:MAG TPA: hypothetical protein VHF22_12325, partial [Planctomycetota bacterium]|nr:hypothetical protein [Planctomycetota bacterium]